MEYVQMTLNEWLEIKQKLRQELIGVKQSFVRIGYMLRKIEDQRGYEQDGYKSIAEFAQKELGLHPSTTSRFMEINQKFSVDGYSELLREDLKDLKRSQLEEMLGLPDEDYQMIRPETARDDIRELKRFNRAEPAAGEADSLRQLLILFFKENRETLNNLYLQNADATEAVREMRELINPSGNRSYRKGAYFLMFYEQKICVKKFGEAPREMSWDDFAVMVQEVYGPGAAGGKTWEAFYGEPEEETGENTECGEPQADRSKPNEQAEEQNKTEEATRDEKAEGERKEDTEETVSEQVDSKTTAGQQEKEEIAPAQKSPENQKILNAEPILEEPKPDMNQPEILEPEITRKEYIESLTAYGFACELEKACQAPEELNARYWEKWLRTKVTRDGYETEEEAEHADDNE